MNDRTVPHSIDAEKSVLGAILLHDQVLGDAATLIAPEDFFRDAHRRIFQAMLDLQAKGRAIDLTTLTESLGTAGELDEVGGPAYISSLPDGMPRSTNVDAYARIVGEKSRL